MELWIFMLIMDLLLPFTMISFGRYFMKKAPKEINTVFGSRRCDHYYVLFAMIADLQLEVDKVHCWKYRERHFDLIRFFCQIKGGIIDELR